MKLTAKNLHLLKLPAGKNDYIEQDDEISGFGARLRLGGSRTGVFDYKQGKKGRRMSLGALTEEAFKTVRDKDGSIIKLGIREQAALLLAKVKLGLDPASEKEERRRRASDTFEPLAKQFLTVKRETMWPSSYVEKERHILKYAKPLHDRPIHDIGPRAIADTLRSIRAEIQQGKGAGAGTITTNRVRSSLSDFFKWAMGEGIITSNPVSGTNKHEERSRERVLGDDELRLIWSCLGDGQYGAIIKLLLFTGCRADEIASLRWSEIGDDAITLPGERTKNGYEHWVPLSDPALQIIRAQPRRTDGTGLPRELVFGIGQGGFSGWSRGKRLLDDAIAEKHGRTLSRWTHHDLRRTCATVMADKLEILPHFVEAVINHRSGHKAGVAGVYNRAEYKVQKRDALVKWAAYLMAVVEGRENNVVPLRQPA
jgi:integrase